MGIQYSHLSPKERAAIQAAAGTAGVTLTWEFDTTGALPSESE